MMQIRPQSSAKSQKLRDNSFSKKSLISAVVITMTTLATTLALTPSNAHARVDEFRYAPSKSSLYSTFQLWRHKSANKLQVTPTSATPAPKTSKSIKSTQKNLSGDITDAEILAQNEAAANDPLEPLNRLVFSFNEVLDFIVFTPVSKTYRTVVPTPVRHGVSNVISNAKAPVTFANDLLQGEPERAKTTFIRFLINSTAGFGGFVDAAEAGGLPKHTEDFGQTLAVWGIGSGPYVVLPVLGPSSPRHIVGRVADTAATPTTWLMSDLSMFERSTPTIAELVTGHEGLLDDITKLRETSPDFYASVRDIYRQSRKSSIANGDISVDDEPLPEIPDE